MAISYVGGVAGTRAGSTGTTTQSLTGLTGGSGSAPIEGDFVIVKVAVGTAAAYVPTTLAISGYSSETMISNTAVTNRSYSQVSYKVQTATPDTSVTIPSSGNNRNAQCWEVHVFRGVDTAAPAAFITANGSATGRPNPGAITPGTAGSWIVACYSSCAGTGTAFTAPTDFATNWLGGTQADTYDAMSGTGYYTGWTSGAYDPAAITAGGTTGATDSWTAYTIALKPAPPPNHVATGVLAGPGSTVAGTAIHKVLHTSIGALTGAGSVVVGSAARHDSHPSTGVLTGPGATIVGTAARTPATVSHAATGVLTGVSATITGSASRTKVHSLTGVLAGAGALVTGSAARFKAHAATGTLTGAGAVVAGSAARSGAVVNHAATGVLTGAGSAIAGTAARTDAPVSHVATGALSGPGAQIVGSASRTGVAVSHAATGVLVGSGAVLSGAASTPTNQVVGKRHKTHAKAYLKRENEILVFPSEAAKEDYLKAQEQAKQAINRAQRRAVIATQPKPVKVDLEQVKEQAKEFAFESIQPLIVENNFERILEIHHAIQQMIEDEDIEILLLA